MNKHVPNAVANDTVEAAIVVIVDLRTDPAAAVVVTLTLAIKSETGTARAMITMNTTAPAVSLMTFCCLPTMLESHPEGEEIFHCDTLKVQYSGRHGYC